MLAEEGHYPEQESWLQNNINSVFPKSRGVLSCRRSIILVVKSESGSGQEREEAASCRVFLCQPTSIPIPSF